MKALLVYTSLFSPNRVIAKLIAANMARRGLAVRCAPAGRIAAGTLGAYDLLILGTDMDRGHASKRLRSLCAAIPRHQLDRLEVALFGVRAPGRHLRRPSTLDELEGCLADRGCELALPPLVVEYQPVKAFLPWLGLPKAERAKVAEFAADVWEASVPEPMI